MPRLLISLAVAVAVVVCLALIQTAVRERCVIVGRLYASRLLHHGFVDVAGVPASEKAVAWRMLAPRLSTALTAAVGYPVDVSNASTWPAEPVRTRDLSLTEDVDGLPLPFSLPDVQFAILGLMDPTFSGAVTFGRQTHWRIRSAVSLLWAVFPPAAPTGALVVQHDAQGWKLSQFPQPGPEPKPVKSATSWHTDHLSQRFTLDDHLLPGGVQRCLRSFVRFSAVLFYAATPGDLGPRQGATGVLPGSHDAVLRAVVANPCPVSKAALKAALQAVAPAAVSAVDRPGLKADFIRVALPTLVHAVVTPQEAMGGRLRTIQNPKAWLGEVLDVDLLPSRSPLRSLCADVTTGPLSGLAARLSLALNSTCGDLE